MNQLGFEGYFEIRADEGTMLCFHDCLNNDEQIMYFDTAKTLNDFFELETYTEMKKYLLERSI